jgi:hypothetical protein
MTRALLVAGIATLGAMAFVSSAVAKSGGNSTNAKLCQKGGYLRPSIEMGWAIIVGCV